MKAHAIPRRRLEPLRRLRDDLGIAVLLLILLLDPLPFTRPRVLERFRMHGERDGPGCSRGSLLGVRGHGGHCGGPFRWCNGYG